MPELAKNMPETSFLCPAGFDAELDWSKTHMRRLRRAIETLPDLKGSRIACSTHLDSKMVPAFEGLVERGASLFLSTCNGMTVRDEVVEHLLKDVHIQVDAWHGMDEEARQKSLWKALAWKPTHLCEVGGEMTLMLHDQNAIASNVLASVEATSTGIASLGNRPLRYPVFNWNNVPVKEHLHNRRMVGISTWHTFFERTRLTLHEKRVVVIGYGAVGQSVADSAKAYGGTVYVVETDRGRALEATYAGWNVITLEEALAIADVIATATGTANVIGENQFRSLKPGVFLLNVGHRSDEIDAPALCAHPHRFVLPFVDEVELEEGRKIYLFAGGSMANLTAGYGDSINAFDLTLAIMVAAVGHAVTSAGNYKTAVHILPKIVWESVL